MNFFEKVLYFLQAEMESPVPYGWFHFLWIGLSILLIVILYTRKKYHNDKQLKIVLGVYGVIALILEILKQLIWSFNYDPITNLVTWSYQWYAAPFQLCTTPIFISIICLFLKKSENRNSLLSYMAFITILGSVMTAIIPDSCFTSDILVNIHTMWLHFGSLVVSVYLLTSGEVELNKKNLINSIIVFLMFVAMAEILNLGIYHSGILNGDTFNMFYISPYCEPSLPVYSLVQAAVPYPWCLFIYIAGFSLASYIILLLAMLIKVCCVSIKRRKAA
jgi:hypothetical protein